MSSSAGVILKNGKISGYFLFGGPVNVAKSVIYSTSKEMNESDWHGVEHNECTCGGNLENVTLYTSNGYCIHFPAKVCFKCKAIIENKNRKDKKGLPGKLSIETINILRELRLLPEQK